jgi:hypothetical protein
MENVAYCPPPEAFIRMHERHRAGLAPDHIDLSR